VRVKEGETKKEKGRRGLGRFGRKGSGLAAQEEMENEEKEEKGKEKEKGAFPLHRKFDKGLENRRKT
jgi:hypothetical protein